MHMCIEIKGPSDVHGCVPNLPRKSDLDSRCVVSYVQLPCEGVAEGSKLNGTTIMGAQQHMRGLLALLENGHMFSLATSVSFFATEE